MHGVPMVVEAYGVTRWWDGRRSMVLVCFRDVGRMLCKAVYCTSMSSARRSCGLNHHAQMISQKRGNLLFRLLRPYSISLWLCMQ